MDSSVLLVVTTAVGMMRHFLAGASEGAAKKTGEALVEWANKRFQGDAVGTEALEALVKNPHDEVASKLLTRTLEVLFDKDPVTLRDMQAVAKEAARKDARANSVRMGIVNSGRDTLQAGRDIKIVNRYEGRTDPLLEVTQIGFTHDSEFDIMVRNLGDTDLIIYKIVVRKMEDPGIGVLPILRPTAKYHVPVDDIPVGGTKSILVSHVVPARSADRFSIALHTTTIYVLEVELYYNKDQVTSFTKRTW
jgi:hypothetical protein